MSYILQNDFLVKSYLHAHTISMIYRLFSCFLPIIYSFIYLWNWPNCNVENCHGQFRKHNMVKKVWKLLLHTYLYEWRRSFFFLKYVFIHLLLVLVESKSHKWLLKTVGGWNHFNGILPNGNRKVQWESFIYIV